MITLDWFIPETLGRDAETRQRARLFLISHLFGPWLGFITIGALYSLDPVSGRPLIVAAIAIAAFWILPFALRAAIDFTLLALVSVENLAFIVLYVSHYYGGISSPFLPWLLTAPLLAFYYLGESPALQRLVLAMLAADFGVFYLAQRLDPSPSRVAIGDLTGIGIISLLCAGLYVTMMARYYARIVASKSELTREVENHKATAVRLREAKEAAEAASRAKSEFLATMSHELRTPLNAVIGFSSIMESESFGPLGNEKYREYAKDIHYSGAHLLGIIDDILDIAKMETGRLGLAESVVDLTEVVRDTCKIIAPRAEKAGLSLVLRLPPDLPLLQADQRKLKQLLLNLLSNSVKFTPSGGRVEIEASARSRRGLSITVRDTGIGIAKEHLDAVLRPFVQVDSSLSRRHGGTGLGLPIVQSIVHKHGGTMKIESALGHGTAVRVTFPLSRVIFGPRPIEAQEDLAHGRLLMGGSPFATGGAAGD